MNSVSNKILLDQKKKILFNLKTKDLFKYKTQCLFHNIPITFWFNSLEQKTIIESLFPSEWLCSNLDQAYSIYIHDPEDYNFSIEQFIDEASQDCIIDQNDNTYIQRDFAAIKKQNEAHLLTTLKFTDGFHNFLRSFLPQRLLKNETVIFHSSCVVENDEAYLFLGHSGAGKTTITTLSKDKTLLGDDMNLIHKIDGKFYVSAGAIGGVTDTSKVLNNLYPLKAAFWLKQSLENKIEDFSSSEASSKYLASMANLFWNQLDKQTIEQVMDFSFKMAASVPLKRLHFKKDKEFWNVIK
jgi:hypothetical protein